MSEPSPISIAFETSDEITDLNVTTALKCEKDEPNTCESGHYSPESGQNEADSSSLVPTARFQLNPYYKKSRLLFQKCSISSPSFTSPSTTTAQGAMSRNTHSPASNLSDESASTRATPCGSSCNTVPPGFHSPSLPEPTQSTMATPTPSYDTPGPGYFEPFSPSCFSEPSPGCYDTPSPSYDPPSPSYIPPSPSHDPPSSSYVPPNPSYDPPSPSYDPPSPTYNPPNISPSCYRAPSPGYDPPSPGYNHPSPGYDPPSPSYYISPSSYCAPPSPSYEALSAPPTLVPPPQTSVSQLSSTVSPSKMSSQTSARSSSRVSNGSSASSSTSSCAKHSISPCSSKSSTSSKHSQSSVSMDGYSSSTECRSPDVSPGASPINQASPISFPPSTSNSSINRNSLASNSPSEYTVRGCSPLVSTSLKNSSSAPAEANSPLSIFGNASSRSSVIGIASSPSSIVGIGSSPSSIVGNASSPSSIAGIASSPSSIDGIASPPSSIDGIAPSPSSMVGIASSPSSMVGIASSPSSIVGIASSPSSMVGNASSPSSIVGIASSPSLNQSPCSIVDAESSSTRNCLQLQNMTVLDEGMQMSSSPTKTSGATEPSTVSNQRSKRKFWEHEFDHVKKLKTENRKIRMICMEAEYIKQNNENRKDLTHIGCSILCVDKSGSMYQEGSFFRVIEPPRMMDYLSMKMKGDLLKSLHIQQNETGHFEFRDEFEIIDDQNKLIECVTEDEALKDLIGFISKFHPYVLVSLDEEIVKIILAKIQGISNISPFSHSPWISWTQILRQLNVSREDVVMDFEDWFIKNMNRQDDTISPRPHALDISTMLMKAIKHVAIKKNGNFYQTLSATSFSSIGSLRSSTKEAVWTAKFEDVELFNSLRPNMTPTIYFESVDVVDLSSDSDDDQAKVTPISWSILSNANQNPTQSSSFQASPWASGYYTGVNVPIRHHDYFSTANLQARLINRNGQSSFSGYFTNGPSSHQGAGPFYPQQNFAQMTSSIGRDRIPQNQNTHWSAYSGPLPSGANQSWVGRLRPRIGANIPNQTSDENGAAVAREGTSLNPRQCINLNNKSACVNKSKLSCAFKMCGTCCRSEKINEPCSGHGRG